MADGGGGGGGVGGEFGGFIPKIKAFPQIWQS